MDQEIASQIVGLGGNTDFSLLSLFLRADFVVKSVIIILLAASVYSWALIFDKYKKKKKINVSILDFVKLLNSSMITSQKIHSNVSGSQSRHHVAFSFQRGQCSSVSCLQGSRK